MCGRYFLGMHFDFVDRVLEISAERIVTLKHVSRAEEYLQDHFAEFPVLPGVFMIECMVQAARRLMVEGKSGLAGGPSGPSRLVLGSVRAVKYGSFVRPGESLRVEVVLNKTHENGEIEFKGEGRVLRTWSSTPTEPGEDAIAVSGRFTLRPIRLALAVCDSLGLGG